MDDEATAKKIQDGVEAALDVVSVATGVGPAMAGIRTLRGFIALMDVAGSTLSLLNNASGQSNQTLNAITTAFQIANLPLSVTDMYQAVRMKGTVTSMVNGKNLQLPSLTDMKNLVSKLHLDEAGQAIANGNQALIKQLMNSNDIENKLKAYLVLRRYEIDLKLANKTVSDEWTSLQNLKKLVDGDWKNILKLGNEAVNWSQIAAEYKKTAEAFMEMGTLVGTDIKIGTQTIAKFEGNVLVIPQIDNATTYQKAVKFFPEMSFKSGTGNFLKKPILLVQKTDGSYACLVQGACFVAGTPVSTPNGFQSIESIAENQMVESYDEATGLFSFRKVKQIFQKTTQQLVRLVVGSDTLYSTPEHLFRTEQQEWFAAGALKPGMRLFTVMGLSTVLQATTLDTAAQVYNFEVETTHTYTVGYGKNVVHNDCAWFASLQNIAAESVDKLKALKTTHPDLIPKLKETLGTKGADVEKFLADFNGNSTMLGKFASGELSVEAWDILRKAKTSFYDDITLLKKIDFLKGKGLSFNQLVTIAELKNVRAIAIAENFVNKTTDLNEDLADLIKNTFTANFRPELSSWSSQFGISTDLIGMLEKLSMTNKLDKPKSIATFFNSQLTKRFDNPGYIEQLNEAIRQIDAGNTIRIEDGVDIVDVTNLKLLEYKAPNSDNIDVLKSNLKSAANQFSNMTTLPIGYSKIAKIKILNSSNPTSFMSQNDLKDYLQAYINANLTNGSSVVSNISFLDEIQIINANGLTRFKLINNIITIL